MTRGPDPARRDLDARVLAWMREPAWHPDEARFEALALELFAFQWERCQPYRRFCEGRGVRPATLSRWQEIPAVPTGAFKELELRSFPAQRSAHVFRTSGTSSSARGALHLDTLELYEASLLPSFARPCCPISRRASALRSSCSRRPPTRPRIRRSRTCSAWCCASSERRKAGSSCARECCAATSCSPRSRAPRSASRTLALCGTAFAFVFLLDELARRGRTLALPPGARIMETGGFKGRSRELGRDALYAEIEQRLGVPAARIVNQYGMTELGSQFHDSILRLPGEPRRKLGPPWARVKLVEPVKTRARGSCS